MIQLKPYQLRTLETLGGFFKQCARDGRPESAFHHAQESNGQNPMPYLPVNAAGLDARMPYVCLRVPTGGGKTLLACHAAGLAMNHLLRAERAAVLWLVPSNTILAQTAEALRNPQHPYRRALELACGTVEIVTIEEALCLSSAKLKGDTVVIVATIQAFRAEDTTGRKVYDQNGSFAEHLLNVPADRAADLLAGADGKPKPSLVNALRLNRPIVIVDEAHNARTDLSFATLGNVLPSCVVELTATPDTDKKPSNVLHRVSAAELKAAEMVKLPLRVITRHAGQKDQLLGEAIALRSDLEKVAAVEEQETGEYLRPILLIQAEAVAACDPLKERLMADFGVAKDEICVSVGGRKDELPGADEIKSRKCKIRIIITVQKLREGWDCPFAYVLCSLRETRSATAIEQLVGRVLRLPGAKSKRHPDLNCAYAFSVSSSLDEVLKELREALESNGFTKAEAQRIILPTTSGGALSFGQLEKTIQVESAAMDPAAAQNQESALGGKVRIDAAKGEITVLVPLDDQETAQLQSCVKTPAAKQQVAELVAQIREQEKAWGGSGKTREPSPYERGENFAVPRLCVREGTSLFEFEKTVLLEHPWRLGAKDASLGDAYNPCKIPGRREGMVDIAENGQAGGIELRETEGVDFVATLHQQVLQMGVAGDYTPETLVAWLDSHIEHRDIPAGESADFMRKVLNGLMAKYGITDISILARDRFRLRDEVELRINQHRDLERKAAFQAMLLPHSDLVVSADHALNFKVAPYEPSWNYEGSFVFHKHYFPKPGELTELTPRGEITEEFLCARFLDQMPEVKHWVRNLSRKSTSFSLQTSTDRFYPDFVCQLHDGRILAVEYKGADRYTSEDAGEKRAVGAVWAARSDGRCVFVMPTDRDFSAIESAVRKS